MRFAVGGVVGCFLLSIAIAVGVIPLATGSTPRTLEANRLDGVSKVVDSEVACPVKFRFQTLHQSEG